MKLMMISDIHGSSEWLDRALVKAKEEQPDQLVLLGDFLYHGPRNPLPDRYDPKRVAETLNGHKHHLIAVRGNCDAEVDQMLLEFPMMADYAMLFCEGRRIYVTHGHGCNMDQLPPLSPGDVFIQGHTHVPVADCKNGIYVLNPGSIALPKENSPHSYGILEAGAFIVKDFAGETVKRIEFN
ncbi:phosphodiesterase [Paenibacillus phocaensis]|uniref:phosphodiesterase n=1 Tax=Paenibacillus phocaensis TaxID=1776378 RepID=UPI0003A912CD|nr:phosphodiesterase [Paenibacillus phocaensis]